MNQNQKNWLAKACNHIPALFRHIENGDNSAELTIAHRLIAGRTVRLYWKAEAVETGTNPLQSDASESFPAKAVQMPESYETPEPRNRKSKKKRW